MVCTNRIYEQPVETDIFDLGARRRYLLKQRKEQTSTLSAGKQVTNQMISWEGKQRARSVSNAENRALELGCHGHFLPGVCESIPGSRRCNVNQLLGFAELLLLLKYWMITRRLGWVPWTLILLWWALQRPWLWPLRQINPQLLSCVNQSSHHMFQSHRDRLGLVVALHHTSFI